MGQNAHFKVWSCMQVQCLKIFPHLSSVVSSPSMSVCSGYTFETSMLHATCMFALPHVSDHVNPLYKWRTLLLFGLDPASFGISILVDVLQNVPQSKDPRN